MIIKNCWSYDLFAIPTGQTNEELSAKKRGFCVGKKIGWDSILASKLRSFYVFLILLAAVFLLFFHISIYCLTKARDPGWMDGGMDGCQLFGWEGDDFSSHSSIFSNDFRGDWNFGRE